MTIPSQSKSALMQNIWPHFLILLLAGLVCNGCLSKPSLKTEMFAFQNPPPAKTTSTSGRVIAVHSVDISALFNNNSFTYRTGPQSYETDPYANFMASPQETIAIAVRAHLRSNGYFKDVVEPGSLVNADEIVDVHVFELYGDFSEPGHAAAVLSMRISLYRSEAAKGEQLILQKDYSRRIPLQKNTAAAVMAGWDKALGEIMTQFTDDLGNGTNR